MIAGRWHGHEVDGGYVLKMKRASKVAKYHWLLRRSSFEQTCFARSSTMNEKRSPINACQSSRSPLPSDVATPSAYVCFTLRSQSL